MELKEYRAKLIGNDDERAVSPVIGVILMVAITVILAAVIAAFVLDLGQGQSANAQAGVQFNEEDSNMTVTVNTVSRADELYIEGSGDCSYLAAEGSRGSASERVDLGTSAGDSKEIHIGSTSDSTSMEVDYVCATADDGSNTDSSADDGSIQIIGVYDGSENVITEQEL